MTVPRLPRFARPVLAAGGVALLSLSLAAGCARVRPAATPAPVAPKLQAFEPPAEGNGRLVIDVVEGPTQIHRVRMNPQEVYGPEGQASFRFYEAYELLCDSSPCVADLPVGQNVLLGFPVLGDRGATEVELVHVGSRPSVYRRSLSVRKESGAGYVLGIVGTSFGGTALATGAALLPIGLADDRDGLTTAGAITLGAGAVLTTLGILGMVHNAPSYRPGAATHFPLSSP